MYKAFYNGSSQDKGDADIYFGLVRGQRNVADRGLRNRRSGGPVFGLELRPALVRQLPGSPIGEEQAGTVGTRAGPAPSEQTGPVHSGSDSH